MHEEQQGAAARPPSASVLVSSDLSPSWVLGPTGLTVRVSLTRPCAGRAAEGPAVRTRPHMM